jgi:AcrR family transcriptional regulator
MNSGGSGKRLRADALRNRARVLAAAEAVLARDGLAAPMSTIAREAGVGVGTIYRQFPTKEALYQAIMVSRMDRLARDADTLLTADDPGAAFFDFFERIVRDATGKKTFADALAAAGLDPKAGTSSAGAEIVRAIEALLTRAQRAGAVRDDLRMPELLALLAATCMAAERNQWSAQLRGRALGIVFDGFRP